MNKLKELSVFFPAYNEEANLENTVEKAIPVLEDVAEKYELIIVDDGSKDKTGEVAKRLAEKYSFIQVITHNPNQGYGAALRSGFYNSRLEWIVTVDSDGQFDFSEVDKLIERSKKADVVVGYRLNRQDSMIRKIFGWGWTLLANLLLGIKVRDVDCAFKLVNRKVIERIPKLQSQRGGMISPELLGKARKAGFKVAEVGVHHYSRKEGKQTGANLKVIFKSFVDLGKLWWQIK
ncbi:glycosyltransferase family 2 protein [Candidatus Shapirobacteria bacterium CG03_land_8_20_14_0_80_40_19]|uniref:Glycosyltransferase family 2 protein n=4 Tax=Candidatus Shapironibacteriota TaxID=1752721 RepID=A0A2M7BD46_9BACT|nr:MAG: cell wall biosynthesis glycosyltransferase [Candidatus Shapirobacteria bacterium CG11_big_fil_rev_8_21_14_0_20_40_12]PIV01024.1 MAG: glycosyltransferase family 2 protein [Candidatus Shapirobacteria bacterium CG03_land_8_20_14_0_80_40_19]PJC29065.1 MAG: glycosyltransferase family 2 protein [Candidatus Shapirobacteria bacterium CG_4_9_14_0_2_um_filter_40_11]PJC75965.1 MAG: glycosyltransferase family 2 protein [Candidatus Shapirobacteria bacterium CG_4_8_14_3_um_filter_39_11]